jgi:integrase/recombinase XerD
VGQIAFLESGASGLSKVAEVLPGHAWLSTTACYTQVATTLIAGTTSPLDHLSRMVMPPS